MAVVARLSLLFSRPVWHDEIFTLWAARLSPHRLLDVLRRDSGPPLFYLLEKPLVCLAEAVHRDTLVRLLPFLATLLLFVAAAFLPREEGRGWFLAMAACSPSLLAYSAEARAYAMLAALALSLFLLLFRSEPTRGRLAAAAVIAGAALWTHYLGVFLVLGCAFVLAFQRRIAPIAALLGGALLFAPWVPVLAAQPEQATSWMREPVGWTAVGFFETLGGSGRTPIPQGAPLPVWLAGIGGMVGFGLLCAVVAVARRERETADAAAVVVITLSLVLAASFIRPVAFPGRSEMVILPIWLWAVARTAARVRVARWLAGAATAVGAGASLLVLAAPAQPPVPSLAVAVVAQQAAPDDRVVAAAAFYLPARLARDREELRATLTAFPDDLASHPGWIAQEALAEADYRSLEASLGTLSSGHRAFLLLHPILRTPRLDRLLSQRGTVGTLVNRPDALVLVCTAR